MKELTSITLCCFDCAGICSEMSKGGKSLFEMLRAQGATFLRIKERDRNSKPIWAEVPAPEELIDKQGSLYAFPLSLSHSKFAKSFNDSGNQAYGSTARISYIHDGRLMDITQSTLEESPSALDDLGAGQLDFAQLMYPGLRPVLGLIDEGGANLLLGKGVKRTELKYIFWANFFGPAYVGKYGRKFLLDAPGWKKEELDDGGILYVVTESYHDWWTKPPKEVFEYFRAQVPGIKLYRAKSSYD